VHYVDVSGNKPLKIVFLFKLLMLFICLCGVFSMRNKTNHVSNSTVNTFAEYVLLKNAVNQRQSQKKKLFEIVEICLKN